MHRERCTKGKYVACLASPPPLQCPPGLSADIIPVLEIRIAWYFPLLTTSHTNIALVLLDQDLLISWSLLNHGSPDSPLAPTDGLQRLLCDQQRSFDNTKEGMTLQVSQIFIFWTLTISTCSNVGRILTSLKFHPSLHIIFHSFSAWNEVVFVDKKWIVTSFPPSKPRTPQHYKCFRGHTLINFGLLLLHPNTHSDEVRVSIRLLSFTYFGQWHMDR